MSLLFPFPMEHLPAESKLLQENCFPRDNHDPVNTGIFSIAKSGSKYLEYLEMVVMPNRNLEGSLTNHFQWKPILKLHEYIHEAFFYYS